MNVQAQQNSGVKISTDSLISIGREKLISVSIRIDNTSKQDFEGQIAPILPKGFGLISEQTIKIRLAKKAHAFYPFKFLVLSNADAHTQEMRFQLQNLNGEMLSQVTSKVALLPIRATELVVLNPSIMLKQIGDSLSINVLVRNMGNQVEELKLVASFPTETGQGKSTFQKNISLSPGSEQNVTFSKIINRGLYQLNNFYINIAGLYKSGDLFGNGIAYVQNASASRQYVNAEIPLGSLNSGLSNQISLSGQNLFNNSQSWQVNGAGATQIGNGILGFSVDAYQWNSINNKPLLSNTWLNYQADNKGITVGNISENLESFINGRGIKLYTTKEEDQHGLEAAVVQKSYNLLGDNFNYGYSAYVKTSFKDSSRHQYNSSLIFDYAPFEQSRSILSSNSVSLFNKTALVMSVNLGGGLSQSLINPTDIKPSLAIGTSLNGTYKKINFSSNNFFSTAYYPGIRRGVLQLNERISKYIGSHNVWIGFSNYGFNPSYQRNVYFLQRNYALQKTEIGWSIPLKINLNLTLTASKDYEKADYNSLFSGASSLSSYRINESFNWHSNDFRQNVFLSLDNGFGKRAEGKAEFQVRLNANWSSSWFNINAYLQRGSFLLAESFNNNISDQEIYRYSLSPSLHRYFFNKKFRTEAGLIFYRDALFGNNITYLAKAEYSATPKTALYISSYEYQYRNSFTNSTFRSLQAGITQKLPDPRQHIAGKKGNLEVQFYKDNNQNGLFDLGDVAEKSGTVLINKIIFIVPASGTIQYNKVPYGSYVVSMPIQNGFQVPAQIIKVDQKNVKVVIALEKSGNVTGKIAINYNELKSLQVDPSLSGFTILVKNKEGKISAVKTGEDGNYSIYLPEGNYEVYPDVTQFPAHIYFDGPHLEVVVKSANNTIIPTINLKVKEKRIEIKRFKN
ncbi:hypothetical protein [Pedobacter mucosus]|uniref:hypothetical protein n=1 Tax=Pedobacter mucosus TaxID=2895286 RepID=UPI001EE44EF2|nr:hypothetical protein [Pedobacter mucosus]UKT62970.1 hypothetical protein LOK61_14485 [Pedobacter mucosus]